MEAAEAHFRYPTDQILGFLAAADKWLPAPCGIVDAIEGAAERQTVYLRTFQTGPDAELAER